jgi:hypothetical protein
MASSVEDLDYESSGYREPDHQLVQPHESLSQLMARALTALQALAEQAVSQEQRVTRNTTTPDGSRQNPPKNGPTRKPL